VCVYGKPCSPPTHCLSLLSQDCSDRLSQVIGERTGQLQELRRQLSARDRELGELRRERERGMGGETESLQNLLKEKEAFIKVRLMPSLYNYSISPFCIHY